MYLVCASHCRCARDARASLKQGLREGIVCVVNKCKFVFTHLLRKVMPPPASVCRCVCVFVCMCVSVCVCVCVVLICVGLCVSVRPYAFVCVCLSVIDGVCLCVGVSAYTNAHTHRTVLAQTRTHPNAHPIKLRQAHTHTRARDHTYIPTYTHSLFRCAHTRINRQGNEKDADEVSALEDVLSFTDSILEVAIKHTHTHTCGHIFVRTYMQAHTQYTHTHISTHKCIHTLPPAHTNAHVHFPVSHVHTHMLCSIVFFTISPSGSVCVCVIMCVCVCYYVCVCVCVCVFVCVLVRAYMSTGV